MIRSRMFHWISVLALSLSVFFILPNIILAHCDTMEGSVVSAAKKALEAGDVNFVLIWVQKDDEEEIQKAFRKTVAVRKLGPEAKELADMYFFETLVRVHRASEGEPYTGLKSGVDLGPAIPAADRAIDKGSVEPLLKLLMDAVKEGVHKRFKEVMGKKNFKRENVEAGREYVKAYVEFMHYVEGIYEASEKSAHGQSHEPGKAGHELHREKY